MASLDFLTSHIVLGEDEREARRDETKPYKAGRKLRLEEDRRKDKVKEVV